MYFWAAMKRAVTEAGSFQSAPASPARSGVVMATPWNPLVVRPRGARHVDRRFMGGRTEPPASVSTTIFGYHQPNNELRFGPAPATLPIGDLEPNQGSIIRRRAPQGPETRSCKRARTDPGSSSSADSNGSLGATSAPRGPQAASPPTTEAAMPVPTRPGFKWQGIDQQTGGKPAYASYIGVKVAQHFETGWGVGVVCCITAVPHRPQVCDQNTSAGRHLPHKKSAFLHNLGGQH